MITIQKRPNLPSTAVHVVHEGVIHETWCKEGSDYIYLQTSSAVGNVERLECSIAECLSNKNWSPLPNLDGYDEVMSVLA